MYRRIVLVLFVALLLSLPPAKAQEKHPSLSADEVAAYKEQSKMMISYLEGTLNFLGDPGEVMAEKEIIINDSYLKMFRDPEVQIEDDLDENREVPLRKDVQAYLKDIIFFYKEAVFSLEVTAIDQITGQEGEIVFKATVNRNLKGVTVNNDTVDFNVLRYIEINLDPFKKDLKIASIYTTKPDEKREMRRWWAELPLPWRDFLGSKILIFDTLPMNQVVSFNDSMAVILRPCNTIETDSLLISGDDTLRFSKLPQLDSGSYTVVYNHDTLWEKCPDTVMVDVAALDKKIKHLLETKRLNISNNYLIQTLQPVSRMASLEMLKASNMLVSDITPLRTLNKLSTLDVSKTAVKSLEALRFSFNLKQLNIAGTPVDTIEVLKNLTLLEKLIIDSTSITDLSPLTGLKQLTFLSMAYTPVTDLKPVGQLPSLKRLILTGSAVTNLSALDSLTQLQYINLDNTGVTDISPLAADKNLTTIQANNTGITEIASLQDNKSLKLIYCDNTGIDRQKAIAFMEKNPACLVIFDSQRLVSWWNGLPDYWQKILSAGYHVAATPTKEQLQKIVNQKELLLSGNEKIKNLSPLKMLFRLESLDVSNTNIKSLEPLSGLNNLRYINLSSTKINTLTALKELSNLQEIRLDRTLVSDIMPLVKNKDLTKVYCDETDVTTNNVLDFMTMVPGCLVVYQTDRLNFWWNNLSDEWQKELSKQIGIDGNPSKEQLQQIANLKTVSIKNNSRITDLEPLTVCRRLNTLSISFTGVSDLSPLVEMDSLRTLNLPNNPITDIEPIGRLTKLVELNLENTGIDDLTPLASLKKLQRLNLAGTKVRRLKPLAGLVNLKVLTINNTKVNRLSDLNGLHNLERLICYNTSLRKKRVDAFKAAHPKVEVVFY